MHALTLTALACAWAMAVADTPTVPPAGLPGGTAPLPALEKLAPRKLSLDEAVLLALKQSPTLEQQLAAIRRAQGAYAEAKSLLQPRLDAGARFNIQGPIPTFNVQVSPTRTEEIAFGKTFTKNFNLTGSYDLDVFHAKRNGITAAGRGVNVARGSLFLARNELVHTVQTIYLAAMRSKELITVAVEAQRAAEEQLRVAEAQVRAGTAPDFDRLRARVQVANLNQNRLTAEANYRRTLADLASVLSLEPNRAVELQAVALPPEPDATAIATAKEITDGAGSSPLAPATLDQALTEAFNRRPEVYRAFWNQRAAAARLDQARKTSKPTVSLQAEFQYNPDQTGLAVETKTYTLLANVSIPIWDGGLRRARVEQAKADADLAAADLRAAQDAVAQDVRRALLDLQDAVDRRRSAAANIAEATEALRIARVRYAAGLAPNVEVIDAESALTTARANAVNAAYDYLSALAGLNRSLGRYAGETLVRLM